MPSGSGTVVEDDAVANLEPEIADFVRQVDAIKRDARALAEGLPGDAFSRQPEPGRWSAGQCIEHLNATHRAMLPGMREAADRLVARGRRAHGPTRHGLLIRWLIKDLEPPVKRAYRTGARFVPPAEVDARAVLEEFLKLHDDLLALLERVNGYDLGAATLRSPFMRWLTYKLGSAIAIQMAHDRRHLWQAGNVVAACRREGTGTTTPSQ